MTLKNMTEPQISTLMKRAAREITCTFPRGTLFTLIVFDDPGVGQYIGNAERQDVIRALRETADRLENREDIERS